MYHVKFLASYTRTTTLAITTHIYSYGIDAADVLHGIVSYMAFGCNAN